MSTSRLAFDVVIPRDAYGSYSAQIQAATIPASGPGVKLVVQCLIPIIVNVTSPSARLRFTADDVLMTRELATEKRSAGTRLGISVVNSGDVFERVGGRLTLLRAIGTRWVQVLATDLPERPILPGNKVLLANSLQRVLSSGKYRLQGTVTLSGRVLARIDKEVVYEGDPNAGALLEDVAVEVRPALAEVDLVPGATRSVVVTLANPTPQPVVVTGAAQLPPALRGVSRDELRGDAFGCADWVTLSPAKITLPGNAERRVRVSVACPREAQMMGRYYAGLLFTAAADDGQVLGTAQSLVVVRNLKVATEPRAEGQHLSLVIEEGTRYIAQARFANTGQTWYRPTAELQVLNRQGGLVQRAALETTAGLVLPLGVPAFVGSFDIAKLEPGAYVLRAVMAFEGQTASQELVLRVTEDKGVKAAVLGEEAAETPAPPVVTPTKPVTPMPAPKVKETKPITSRR